MTHSPLRIAMWSGPRNISTALMRSWGNRHDTAVVDEPFYAYYLKQTRVDHPGAAEVIAHGETDWRKIVAALTAETSRGKSIYYQKQMSHHLLPQIPRDWLALVTNCFLIRDPSEVIASYVKKNGEPTLPDLGFVQQAEIFDWVCDYLGAVPPVIDAADVSREPRKTLELLCKSLGLAFDEAMLSWPPGLRESDGIWARHWYHEVADSTSFRKHEPRNNEVPGRLRAVHNQCRAVYERLHQHRLH